jgi:hypothetical protein
VEYTTETEQQPVAHVATPVQGNPPAAPASAYEHCASCGAAVLSDQRYCLSCGQRRGDPRLPFMDAVVFMEAMKPPAPTAAAEPSKRSRRISPNAALIAGVGTLLLALGIGVLIGRTGDEGGASTAQQAAPIVIKGGGGEAQTASTSSAPIGGGKGAKAKQTPSSKTAAEVDPKGSEEVLKPADDVKLPPPTTGVGDKCEKGSAGCDGGEFTGDFFGE